MKRGIALGIVGCLFLAGAAWADGGKLGGNWLTAKGATVLCGDTSCTMVKPAGAGDKAAGTVVLKDYKADGHGVGTAMLVKPRKDGEYIPITTQLVGDSLTLTLKLGKESTSVTWTRKVAGAK